MIDFGFVISSFVPLVLLWMYDPLLCLPSLELIVFHLISFGENHLRAVWRLSHGLGCVPALAVFLWRLRMEEPTRYKKDSMKNVAKIPYWLIVKRYWASLAAISVTWFAYDFSKFIGYLEVKCSLTYFVQLPIRYAFLLVYGMRYIFNC